MRPLDFIIYYCMQQFKTGNLNFSTPLGRACGVIGFTVGNLIFIIIELTLCLAINYQILDHFFPFLITFIVVYLSTSAIAYYIYHSKKRYQYIQSSQYRTFKLTNTIGFTICIMAFALSMILAAAISVYAGDYIN
jgi:hypothetical protein